MVPLFQNHLLLERSSRAPTRRRMRRFRSISHRPFWNVVIREVTENPVFREILVALVFGGPLNVVNEDAFYRSRRGYQSQTKLLLNSGEYGGPGRVW